MTKQDCDRRRQNRSAGARPSIGGTKSVTRDTATKVRYRGSASHMLQDPAWMHGANRTIQNRTEMGTQSSREMTK